MRALLVVSLSSLLVACGSSASSPSSDLASDGGNDASFTQDDDGGVAPTDASEDARPEGGFTATSCASLQPDGGAATSKWAQVGDAGTLTYETLSTGETLLDFSGAGYMGGGVALPTVPAVKMVSPSGADDTNAIQAAITAVAAMPIANGVRGAVLLAAGSFQLDGSLSITASGVVLRGSGWGTGGTTLNVTGSPRMLISVNGAGSWSKQGTPILLTDTYVASGAKTIHVASTTGLAVGTNVLIDRTVTQAWLHFMGMDDLVRDGATETWLAAGDVSHEDRTITAINGKAITLDMPISDSLDSQYTTPPGVTIAPYTFTGRIEQVGIEAMHIVAPTQTVPISDPIFGILEMSAVQNGWVRNVVADEFTTGIAIDGTAKWITIQDSTVERTAPIDGSAGYPFDYSVDGQATLIQRCTASGDNVFSYATQDRANGPNVVLDMRVKGSPINAQPHQRWATGLLLDNVDTPTGGISLMDRGWYGSGHGWAIGFGVVWNGVASEMLIQQPPGSMNWAIGSSGTRQMSAAPGSDAGILPEGTIDSPMVKVSPNSLYLEQLCERLGPAAVHAIGY
jgi:hypothetical protein